MICVPSYAFGAAGHSMCGSPEHKPRQVIRWLIVDSQESRVPKALAGSSVISTAEASIRRFSRPSVRQNASWQSCVKRYLALGMEGAGSRGLALIILCVPVYACVAHWRPLPTALPALWCRIHRFLG